MQHADSNTTLRHAGTRRTLRRLTALIATALITDAFAQSEPDAMLPAVEIIAVSPLPGLGIEHSHLPFQVQTVSTTALDNAHAGNLMEHLAERLNGVNLNNIQGSPFQTDVTYRGFRASPILGASQGMSVYLDGVRINEPFGDVVNWDMLPHSAIGSMMLVPGSNPAYGLNTMGGALVLTTKSGLSHPGGELEVSTGSVGRRRVDFSYGRAYEDGWHAFVAATGFSEDGWRAQSPGRLANLYLKAGRRNGATQWDLSLLSGASVLVGNGLMPSYRKQNGVMVDGLYEADARAAYTFPDETRNRLIQAALTFQHQRDAHTDISASAYARSSRRDGINGDVNPAYADYIEHCEDGFDKSGAPRKPGSCNLTQADGAALHSAALNASATRQKSQGLAIGISRTVNAHRLAAGLTLDNSSVDYEQTTRDAWFGNDRGVVVDPAQAVELAARVKGNSTATGLYVSDTWTMLPQTWLTLSGRMNRVRVGNTLTNPNGPQPTETFTYHQFNPALGVAHQLGYGIDVFANLSQSNRVPTVIELGCADPTQPCRLPVGLQSDPYLKQVVSHTAEVGARWKIAANASVNAAIYRTVNHDDIQFFTAVSSQQGYFANFERTRHQGVDLAITGKIETLDLRASYSYLDATYDVAGKIFTGLRNVNVESGTPIAGLPRHTLKIGADWKPMPNLKFGGDVVAVSSVVTRGNEDGLRADPVAGKAPPVADWRIRGHALLNLRAAYRPMQAVELFARINNVFDRRYETFGNIATDAFPGGQLLQPHIAAADATTARFVAPGAPRQIMVGARHSF